MTQISKKVIIVGHFNVGKTSLIQKFVHSKFSDKYITTIGVNIDKKVLQINGTELNMILWDIAGEAKIEKVIQSFMVGAHGIIYVFDLTRESTYENIQEQLEKIRAKVPNAPLIVIGNKSDMVSEADRCNIIANLSIECNYTSSAKTGENVESMFLDLGKKML